MDEQTIQARHQERLAAIPRVEGCYDPYALNAACEALRQDWLAFYAERHHEERLAAKRRPSPPAAAATVGCCPGYGGGPPPEPSDPRCGRW